MLLGTLGVSLLGNILAGKRMNRAGEGIVRAGHGNKKVTKNNNKKQNGFLMLPHPLTNFEIKKNIIVIKRSEVRRMKQDLMMFILEIIYPK